MNIAVKQNSGHINSIFMSVQSIKHGKQFFSGTHWAHWVYVFDCGGLASWWRLSVLVTRCAAQWEKRPDRGCGDDNPVANGKLDAKPECDPFIHVCLFFSQLTCWILTLWKPLTQSQLKTYQKSAVPKFWCICGSKKAVCHFTTQGHVNAAKWQPWFYASNAPIMQDNISSMIYDWVLLMSLATKIPKMHFSYFIAQSLLYNDK